MNIPVICEGCGITGSFSRVAGLSCPNCHTDDRLNLWEGQKTAAGPNQSAGGNGATGWTETRPNVLEGWDEYQGPSVGPNPQAQDHLVGDPDAYNDGAWSRGNPGYIPGGGYDNAPRHVGPTTGVPPIEEWDEHRGPESGGARWQGKGASLVPLHVTLPDGTKWEGTGRVVEAGRPSSDPLGSPEDHLRGTYSDPSSRGYQAPKKPAAGPSDHVHPLPTHCSNCGQAPTQLVKDASGDSWWNCPKCGSLANVDKNPNINPFSPPIGFTPDRSMKTKKSVLSRKKTDTGQIFKMFSAIKTRNDGLSEEEALTLARKALLKFGSN